MTSALHCMGCSFALRTTVFILLQFGGIPGARSTSQFIYLLLSVCLSIFFLGKAAHSPPQANLCQSQRSASLVLIGRSGDKTANCSPFSRMIVLWPPGQCPLSLVQQHLNSVDVSPPKTKQFLLVLTTPTPGGRVGGAAAPQPAGSRDGRPPK